MRSRLFAAGTLAALIVLAISAAFARASDGSWTRLGPAPHCWGPAAAFDPLRNRMLVFGGSPFDETGYGNSFDVVWELSLSGSPSWKALTSIGGGPLGRESPSMIYDPVRDRLIMFGGLGSAGNLNDLWALSLSGATTWTQLFPTGLPPVGRTGHTAIYDPVGDRMIVFAGSDGTNTDHNDLFVLSLGGSPAWTQLAPTGTPPPIRSWHSAIYDPTRARMVIFAGWIAATGGSRNDAWVLDLSGTPTWSLVTASGTPPLARNSHTAIYDPVGDRMVVFGGLHDPGNPALTVLSFAGSPAWSLLSPSGTPPATRDGAAGIYDATNQRLVVYGGNEDEFGHAWAATLTGSPAWSSIAPVGAPKSRSYAVVYDSIRDRLVAMASTDSLRVWTQSLAGEPAWSRLPTSGTHPPPRGAFSMVYDEERDRVVICGGYYVDPVDAWALDFDAGTVWSQIATSGTPPSFREYHSAILDPTRDRMVIYGGDPGGGSLSTEVWTLTMDSSALWSNVTPLGPQPVGRQYHAAIYDPVGDRMVICGGYEGFSSHRRDVWALGLGSLNWTEIVPAVPLPTDRTAAGAIYDAPRGRMLLFAGLNGSTAVNELWALSLTGSPVWTLLSPAGLTPTTRTFPGAIYDPVRDRMLIFGGADLSSFNNYRNDTWAWSPQATTAVMESGLDRETSLMLAPPLPNPSPGEMAFHFTLRRAAHATLDVFDPGGRRVRRLLAAWLPAGSHRASWDGADERGRRLERGLYFVQLESDGEKVARQVVRTR